MSLLWQSKQMVLYGTVVDEMSGDPIPGVRVVVDGKSNTLFRTPEFTFRDILAGENEVTILPPP